MHPEFLIFQGSNAMIGFPQSTSGGQIILAVFGAWSLTVGEFGFDMGVSYAQHGEEWETII
jgi:hypothetical protein